MLKAPSVLQGRGTKRQRLRQESSSVFGKQTEPLHEFGAREGCRGLGTQGAADAHLASEAQIAVPRRCRFVKHFKAEQAKY